LVVDRLRASSAGFTAVTKQLRQLSSFRENFFRKNVKEALNQPRKHGGHGAKPWKNLLRASVSPWWGQLFSVSLSRNHAVGIGSAPAPGAACIGASHPRTNWFGRTPLCPARGRAGLQPGRRRSPSRSTASFPLRQRTAGRKKRRAPCGARSNPCNQTNRSTVPQMRNGPDRSTQLQPVARLWRATLDRRATRRPIQKHPVFLLIRRLFHIRAAQGMA
jgi:hypothetical protein